MFRQLTRRAFSSLKKTHVDHNTRIARLETQYRRIVGAGLLTIAAVSITGDCLITRKLYPMDEKLDWLVAQQNLEPVADNDDDDDSFPPTVGDVSMPNDIIVCAGDNNNINNNNTASVPNNVIVSAGYNPSPATEC